MNGRGFRVGWSFAAVGLLAALAFVSPVDAFAQQDEFDTVDGRWMAYMGCWRPVSTASQTSLEAVEASASSLVCFRPVEGSGVEMATVDGGQVVTSRTLRADGQRHEFDDEGCSGWSRGEFSARSGRVFFTTEEACDGDVRQTSSDIMSIVTPDAWVYVRAVETGGETSTWSARYEPATAGEEENAGFGGVTRDRFRAIQAARAAGAARPTVDDVIEAHDASHPDAVGAWLAERGAPLDLDADALIRLADAGVPESVIDMAVAVSFPSHFAVDRGPERLDRRADDRYRGRGARAYGAYGYGWRSAAYACWGLYGAYYGSALYSPCGLYRYDPFGYRYGFGYGYRYRGLGFGSPFGFGGRYIPVVIGGGNDGTGGGRVLQGRGYQRSGASSGTGRRAKQPASTGSSGRRATGSSSRSGSSGRSGRKAKPRSGSGCCG